MGPSRPLKPSHLLFDQPSLSFLRPLVVLLLALVQNPPQDVFLRDSEAFKVWGHPGSGNSHKARLMLSFLGLPFEQTVPSSLRPASPELLEVNPAGSVPVLVDPNAGDVVVADSHAIVTYLIQKYGSDEQKAKWFPVSDALIAARIAGWMSFSANEIQNSLVKVRVAELFSWDIPFPLETAYELSKKTLARVESELAKNKSADSSSTCLVAGTSHPTIADVVVFPYVALTEASSKGKMHLSDYPLTSAWVEAFKARPNYLTMPGLE